MGTLIVLFHVLICLVLIIAVLLQSGKAADLAGSFGGVGSQTAFGPRGATTLLAKVTTGAAVLFMLTSIGLWILSTKGEKSVMKNIPGVTETQKSPAAVPSGSTEKKEASSTQKEEKKEETQNKPDANK
ncbi:MAG: preprotein translocase subunit SecG [Candidatus Aminicenantales bacterium]